LAIAILFVKMNLGTYMKTQTLLAPFRRAINQYNMIADGDKIAVGISGGKDSLTLLALLKAYQRFSPQKFESIPKSIRGRLKTARETIIPKVAKRFSLSSPKVIRRLFL